MEQIDIVNQKLYKGSAFLLGEAFKFVDRDVNEHELVYYLSDERHGDIQHQLINIQKSDSKIGKIYYIRVYSPLNADLEFGECVRYVEITK